MPVFVQRSDPLTCSKQRVNSDDIEMPFGLPGDLERCEIVNGQVVLKIDSSIPVTIEEARRIKIAEIDAKTQILITTQGFWYKGSQFSMSMAAQLNWNSIGTFLANDLLMYPIPVSTITEKGGYILVDESDVRGFLLAAGSYQLDQTKPLARGRAIKALIEAAETVEAVNAIVDDR